MPRYFFDLIDDGRRAPDKFGEDLIDLTEASDQAQVLVVDIARERMPDGQARDYWCEVRDEAGVVIYTAHLSFEGKVTKLG